jgi:hypothetical protein
MTINDLILGGYMVILGGEQIHVTAGHEIYINGDELNYCDCQNGVRLYDGHNECIMILNQLDTPIAGFARVFAITRTEIILT